MIVCSNCLHHNPNEAVNCEACGAHLPETACCPNCGGLVLDHAHFCGQCGFNLQLSTLQRAEPIDALGTNSDALLPDPAPPEPVFSLSYSGISAAQASKNTDASDQDWAKEIASSVETQNSGKDLIEDAILHPQHQISRQEATLMHEQSNTLIEFQPHQKIIRIGKPNDRVPPDINVSVFPSSEVVSRVHAYLHIEDGTFFVEDVGSANGTYLNNMQLTPGTRYRLRHADRICLGKGDLVTFVFQNS